MRITAIMVALNEAPFIEAALAAIYPFVHRIFVQTGYDRSWNNQPVEPDGTVERLLSFPDPDGKLALLVRRIPDEALARNLLMRMDGYTLDHRHRNTVGMGERIPDFCRRADYFWILDGDELFDPRSIPAMLAFVERNAPRALLVRGLTYFKSWNYVVEPSDEFFQPGFLRPDLVFRENRNLDLPGYLRLLFNKYTRSAGASKLETHAHKLLGIVRLPTDVAVFHHASYVGDDARIFKKIKLSVHYDTKMMDWYQNVWLTWTPSARNLHPIHPEVFRGVRHVPTSELPPIIRDQPWPPGYLEEA